MWAQDWSSLIPLFVPQNETIDLQENLVKKNWTVHDMVSLVESLIIYFFK